MGKETAAGGARPAGRPAMAGANTENSRRGESSTKVIGVPGATAMVAASTWPCAKRVTAHSCPAREASAWKISCSDGEAASRFSSNTSTTERRPKAIRQRWIELEQLNLKAAKTYHTSPASQAFLKKHHALTRILGYRGLELNLVPPDRGYRLTNTSTPKSPAILLPCRLRRPHENPPRCFA